jgi:hypothetical protein
MSVGQIAQLIVPADGLGSIQLMVPDYARGRLFGIGIHSGSPSGGCLRAYSLSLVTQSPSLSVETNAWGSSLQMGPEAPVDIDPVTGNIIGQWYAGTVLSPIRKINPVTLTLTASYGITANLGSYPAGIELAENVICVACGTLANPNAQVGYALIKESVFSGHIAALRVSDTLANAGFYGNVVSGSTNNRGQFCRGASGPSGGSIYGSWAFTSPTATIPLYKVTVAPGAELYNPASWPATNPYITSATIGTIAAASVDATWSHLTCASIGYDQSDGNVLMTVTTNDAVSNRRYLIKLNATSAAVMWALPVGAGVGAATNLNFGEYSGGIAPILNTNTEALTVDTSDGSTASLTVGGLTLNGSGYFWDFAGSSSGLYVWQGTYNQAASPNSPAPVSGTPASFSGPALIEGFFTSPANTSAVGIGDLWFSPSDSFVDLRTESARRKFVTLSGATTYLNPDGSAVLGATPPIYLTISPGETANDFGVNRGSGGTFTRAGGDLAAWTGGIPPCGPYYLPSGAVNAPQGADPQVRLSVSDDGGRTFSLLQKWRSMGKIGEYTKRLRWLKMGQFRQREIRLEITDPVRRNIIGIYIDTAEGLDW